MERPTALSARVSSSAANIAPRRLVPVARSHAGARRTSLAARSAARQRNPRRHPHVPAKRPKIGLVLSGGGARGLTHIGVLKVLRRDARAGRLHRGDVHGRDRRRPVRERHDAATRCRSARRSRLADAVLRQPAARSDRRLPPQGRAIARFPLPFEIGFRDGELLLSKGALSGSNLELFLHELTRNVDDVENFDKLPIPFRAVATNMVTGKDRLRPGPLYQAMRASMSVPGMFAPVELDGRILGDGGLVNNLPVDVVRAMGADIVIAVNIGTPLMSRDQLQSVVGYASQMLNILTEQNVRAQLALLRPGRHPDLARPRQPHGRRFRRGAEIRRARRGGGARGAPQLAALRAAPDAIRRSTRQRAPRFAGDAARDIDFVRSRARATRNPEVLEDAAASRPLGEPFDAATLDSDLARLYGTRRIRADRLPARRRSRTSAGSIVNVSEKSWGPNFLRFGLAVDRPPGRDVLQL